MAPPRIELDLELVEKLAGIGCTMIEIAAVCKCSVDTLERRCADVIIKGRESAKASLRRMQWKKAEKGNTTMLIWLGKNMLGKRYKNYYEHSGKDSGPIVWDIKFNGDSDTEN